MRIDINTDTGESFGRWTLGDDQNVLGFVTSANIACGAHAGDPLIMDRTVGLCVSLGVSIGAHPGFPDIQGFGRREFRMSPQEIEAWVIYQIGALRAFTQAHGTSLGHVKPHGSLYNMASLDESMATAIAHAVAKATQKNEPLVLVGLSGSAMISAAQKVGIPYAREGFCDRAYLDAVTLAPRSIPGAVITDPPLIAKRAVAMVTQNIVYTATGQAIPLEVDTICIHGDTPGASHIAQAVRQALTEAGVEITSRGIQEVELRG